MDPAIRYRFGRDTASSYSEDFILNFYFQYEAEASEDQPVGILVAQVSAKSLDTGTNAKLRYVISGGNEHQKFNINEDTGNG